MGRTWCRTEPGQINKPDASRFRKKLVGIKKCSAEKDMNRSSSPQKYENRTNYKGTPHQGSLESLRA
jgi:hypothetical protein